MVSFGANSITILCFLSTVLTCATTSGAMAQTSANAPLPPAEDQRWNWHVQNTDIVQGYPGFSAKYSGPNSLPAGGQTRESVSLDLMAGVRLWHGAEAHIDAMMWQGFGVNNTRGIEGFPNGEAFRLGTDVPNGTITRLFIRQTIGLGGEQEDVADDQLTLAGKQDVSRLTLTLGRMSAKDIFDNNAYANDPCTQFMNWALMANEAWDYPADAIGYTTGLAVELNQPKWALRYGFFQLPRVSNGLTAEDRIFKWPYDSSAQDGPLLKAWGMVLEFERRYTINTHPGAARLLAYLNRAHMGSYQAAVDSPTRPADIEATRDYRYKFGFGVNVEQEVAKDIGIFSRIGWSDGRNEAWVFADVDYTGTLGISVKGESWHRPNDTFGLAGVLNGISRAHQKFFQTGGTGILAGDGNLSYGWEKIIETYYDFQIWKIVHAALDYQFVGNPAFNRDRGPVSVFAVRLHWEF
ncbi:MAG: carbohydrate porin [Planctomycetota bacterium]|nr:carbohydrate porin [Planctomycetota bacterium]MDE1888915.1 carbohydrate porin [Planctomycetota bacterium]MDE2215745.1 carbohydrate porin [Planctomycetota bacterium]